MGIIVRGSLLALGDTEFGAGLEFTVFVQLGQM